MRCVDCGHEGADTTRSELRHYSDGDSIAELPIHRVCPTETHDDERAQAEDAYAQYQHDQAIAAGFEQDGGW